MISPFEKARKRKYLARARRKDPDKYVGGLLEIIIWEEYFALTRRRPGPKSAFALGCADYLIGEERPNPINHLRHPIVWRAYVFGKQFAAFFKAQEISGDIKYFPAFIRLHIDPLKVT